MTNEAVSHISDTASLQSIQLNLSMFWQWRVTDTQRENTNGDLITILTDVRFRICGGRRKLVRLGLKRQRRSAVWNLGARRGAEAGECFQGTSTQGGQGGTEKATEDPVRKQKKHQV